MLEYNIRRRTTQKTHETFGLNARQPEATSKAPATAGAGMSDYAEFIAGTNPTNAASRFYFTGTTIQSNRVVQLHWTAVTNRLYQVSTSTNLSSWPPVTDWQQASGNPTLTYAVTNTGDGSRFYRVQVQP